MGKKTTSVSGTPGLDPALPNVTLILGGVERHLCFDFNAIVLAEKATGVNLLHAIVQDINATNLRGLLWASLLKENPELTVEEVGSWITMRNSSTIYQALITAWFGSVAEPELTDDPEGKQKAQA
jgi:hypothetical protein